MFWAHSRFTIGASIGRSKRVVLYSHHNELMVVIGEHRDQTQFDAFAKILQSKHFEVPNEPGLYRFEGDEAV